MKIKVSRNLRAGLYHVNFEVSDFTPEELAKMASFGIPQIGVRYTASSGPTRVAIKLNAINKNYDATFSNEEEAKQYEDGVLSQIRDAMKLLRESQDKFTGSEEVEL